MGITVNLFVGRNYTHIQKFKMCDSHRVSSDVIGRYVCMYIHFIVRLMENLLNILDSNEQVFEL